MSTKRAKRRVTLWVVEMLNPYAYHNKWRPTVGVVALSRAEGRDILHEWRRHSPDKDFRLSQYRATE